MIFIHTKKRKFPGLHGWRTWFTALLVAQIFGLLGACAAPQGVVDAPQFHAFGFDARYDSPDSEILAFRYGPGTIGQLRMPYWKEEKEGSRQATGIHATMSIEGGLYVKWRLRSTGVVYEDTVDLKPLLPKDLASQRVYFVAQGSQLMVFLSDLSKQKPLAEPIVGPFKIQLYPTKLIYPTIR